MICIVAQFPLAPSSPGFLQTIADYGHAASLSQGKPLTQQVTGATYTLHSSTSSTMVAGVLTDSVGASTTTGLSYTVGGVANNVYYWQVRATDAAGNVGPWSDVWSLEVRTVAAVAPLVSPTVQLRTFALPTTSNVVPFGDQLTTLSLPIDSPSIPAADGGPTAGSGSSSDSASGSVDTSPATSVNQTGFDLVWLVIVFGLLLIAGIVLFILRRRRGNA